MTWEHLLSALIVAILGIAALVYGAMRLEFTWTDLLMFVLIALGIAALVYGTVAWDSTGKDLPAVTTWADLLPTFIGALVGTIPGTLAVILILRDRRKSYLHFALRVDLNENGFLSAMTEVENKNITNKPLSNALLLVGPEHESPIETMNQLNFVINYTNDIVKFKIHNAITGPQGRALIPLPFFYSENVRIADEKVSYRAPIDTRYILRGIPYSVRFFISTPERPHRSTHDSFVLPLS